MPGSWSGRKRLERDYLLSIIDTELFWVDRARFPFNNPAWYIDNLDPDVYLSRDYAPAAETARGLHRLRAGDSRRSPPISAPTCRRRWPKQPHRARHRRVRRLCGVLPQRCAEGVRRGEGRQAAEGPGRRQRSRRQSHGRSQDLARVASARMRTDKFALGSSALRGDAEADRARRRAARRAAKIGRADLERNLAALQRSLRAVSAARHRSARASTR